MCKHFIQPFFILGIFTLCFPLTLNAKGLCSWEGPITNNVFWNPEFTYFNKDFKPFLFSFDRLYEYQWDEPAYRYKDNSAEWIEYCSHRASRAEVDSFVYASTLKEVEAVLSAAKSGKLISGKFKDNTMAKFLKENKDIAALEYLVFAKKCEPHVALSYYEAWEDTPERDPRTMRLLYQEAQKNAENATKPTLKLRYAYQAVRMAHYAQDFSQAIGTYDKLIAPLKSESVIKYWALGNKAGALMQSGRRAEALYLFSVVFDKCPTKRVNMYYSFHPESDTEWRDIMTLCKNNREKSTLHLLRAIDPVAQATEEMENIYQLDPQSDYLTLLLVREINKLECNLMDYDFKFEFPIPVEYKYQIHDDGSQMSSEYLYSFKKFVSKKVVEQKVKDLRVWKLAEGYLSYLTGDFNTAESAMSALESTESNAQTLRQIQTFKFLLNLAKLTTIDRDIEEKFYTQYLSLGYENPANYSDEWEAEYAPKYVYQCMMYGFSRCYKKQGDIGKAFLCEKGIRGLFENMELSVIDNILTWALKPSNSFEKHLLEKGFKNTGLNGLDVLWDVKGTYFLRKGDLFNAKAAYEKTSSEYRMAENSYFSLHFNPLESFILDRHDEAEERYGNSPDYHKLWLVDKLMTLENEASQNPQKAAENYAKIGNAWYNMSYFAPGWRALAWARSGSDLFYFDTEPDEYITLTEIERAKGMIFYQMNPALEWYSKALTQNPTPELGAKIRFGIAKCRLNQTYTKDAKAKDLQAEYDLLRKNYASTKYYAEVIRECSYFRSYVGK